MSRVKRSVASRQYRKKILKLAKGFYGRAKNCFSIAVQKVEKGLAYAYRDRKVKKRDFRALWIVRLNAALRNLGVKYSDFIYHSKTSEMKLNRKMLAKIATENHDLFSKLVLKVMNKK